MQITAAFPSVYRTDVHPFAFLPHSIKWQVLSFALAITGVVTFAFFRAKTGSSGAPIVSNTASPANVTLSPSPTGDAPGDVILFVKNRSAGAIRSLFVAGISGNIGAEANQSR